MYILSINLFKWIKTKGQLCLKTLTLMTSSRLISTFCMLYHHRPHPISQLKVRLLQEMAGQMLISILCSIKSSKMFLVWVMSLTFQLRKLLRQFLLKLQYQCITFQLKWVNSLTRLNIKDTLHVLCLLEIRNLCLQNSNMTGNLTRHCMQIKPSHEKCCIT